ncbi:MAG: amidohydrolase family protein [Syntrophobacteraceae bacterium]
MSKSYCFSTWLVDGTGARAKKNALLCIENGLISSVRFCGPEQLSALEKRCEDLQAFPASTMLPGLIDCHVHLAMSGKTDPEFRAKQLLNGFEQNGPLIEHRVQRCLNLGIMALRDGGDIGGHALRYMRQNASSRVRVKCAGKAWRAPGRYGKFIGKTPEPGLSLAESLKADCAHVDHIKILNSGINSLVDYGRQTEPQFGLDELARAFGQAKELGLKIMVHANGRLPVQIALDAGCDSIEHGFFMGEENLKKMADRQIFWAPTAVTMKALSDCSVAGAQQAGIAGMILQNQLEQMRRARELGVGIVSGTDAGSFGVRHGQALAQELELIAQAGFSVEQTIQSATHAGARLLGLDHELGSLRPGMPANFLVVPGPPSDLPGSLALVTAVYLRGARHSGTLC